MKETPAKCALPRLAAACATLLLLASCGRTQGDSAATPYDEELRAWKSERLAGLTGDEGWLTLVGLYWLEEGENRIGSDPACEVLLPAGKAPRHAGSLRLSGGAVRLEARPESGLTHDGRPVTSLDLRSDADGRPTVLSLGSLSFHVIKRGDRLGVRVRDSESPARARFAGLEYFPADEGWRLRARFEPYDPPRPVPITNVLGMEEEQPSPGALVFEAGGVTYRLDALAEKGEDKLFIIFADATSGRETYGAGRYVYAGPPDKEGFAVIDFNKAHSPPCAFTDYATCPLPPTQNRLPLRVEAGEKFAGH